MRRSGPPWSTLGASAPVPPADLAAAVQSAAVADAEPGEAVEDCMHPNPRMTLRAAVLAAASTDGYLTAATQSADLWGRSGRSRGCDSGRPRPRSAATAHHLLSEAPPRWRAHSLGVHSPSTSWLAQARVPPAAAAALALARMTAVRKPDGGVRGIIIATGDVFRRLVSRALAKTWVSTFDAATRPFQHALSARSGMDALVARLRIALETFLGRAQRLRYRVEGRLPSQAPPGCPCTLAVCMVVLRATISVLLVG